VSRFRVIDLLIWIEVLKGIAVDVQISTRRVVDWTLLIRFHFFLEFPIERPAEVHADGTAVIAWNYKMVIVDSIIVLEIEVWIRIGCLQVVVKDWAVGKSPGN
jgi:hypothetical protein